MWASLIRAIALGLTAVAILARQALPVVLLLVSAGALRYEPGAVESEQPDEPTTMDVRPNGPLYLRGRLRLRAVGGRTIVETPRAALCRCGASGNKPFCDNSHRRIGFRE